MLRWLENWSAYGTDIGLLQNGAYAEVIGSPVLIADPDPNATGIVLWISSATNTEGVRWVLPSTQTAVGIAARLWMASLPPNNTASPAFQWRDGTNTVLCTVWVSTTGQIVADGPGGVELGRTTGPVLVANAYNHIEAKATINAATGSIVVRVNGVEKLALTNVNTGAGPCAQVVIGAQAPGSEIPSCAWKDLIIWDTAAGEVTDFVGQAAVVDLTPDADIAFNWQASIGTTGFNLLDNSPPLDATEYITAIDPPPAASTFGLSDLPPDVTSVKGLMSMVRASKTDGGDGNLRVGMVSGATTGWGADRPITPAFTFWSDVHETDPNTGVPWTPPGVDAAQISVDRTV